MTTITIPKHLEAWAEAEVAAGREESLNALVVRAFRLYRRNLETAALRQSFDDAVAEADGDG